MKPMDKKLTEQLYRSARDMTIIAAAMREKDMAVLATQCTTAAALLSLMHEMLTDDKPLTNWDLIDTQLHQLLAEGDVPTLEEAQKIQAVQRMLREVSGE